MTAPVESAKEIIRSFLRDWGLLELAPDVDSLLKDGLDVSTVTLRLQETEAYKRRFKGNEDRRAKGLPVLTPAEYLAAESAYRQSLRSYGLPESFYDAPDDFHTFIGNDVSPEEVNARAAAAQETWLTTDQQVKDTWRSFYGLTDGAAIASILDPKRALPIVNRMVTAAKVGADMTRGGLSADRSRLESYADRGLTAQQAAQGVSQLGQTFATESAIARRFGTDYGQGDAEEARLMGTASALRKQRELAQSEQALFDARASADQRSLNRRTTGSY